MKRRRHLTVREVTVCLCEVFCRKMEVSHHPSSLMSYFVTVDVIGVWNIVFRL
jgi:hypothetical protein